MSDNPYGPYASPDPDPNSPYSRPRSIPIAPRGWAAGGARVVGSLTPEDIQAIAVAVADELEKRK